MKYRSDIRPEKLGIVVSELEIRGNSRTVGHNYTPLFVVLWTDGISSDEFVTELEYAHDTGK